MDWSHLKVVLAVSRGKSLTAAAHILNTDQTTMGRRLTALESDLGATLFIRSKAGFLPTDHGARAIALAEQMERDIDALVDDLSDPEDGAKGVVRLMGNTWMLQRLAEHALPALLKANPNLTIKMSGRLPPTPLHGETTISLWFDAQARPPDRALPFAYVPYGAFASETVQDNDNRWVLFQDDDASGPSFTKQVRQRLGKDATVQMTATDATILAAALQGGAGKGHLPLCIGQASGLRRVQTTKAPLDRILHIHANPALLTSQRIVAVLDWLESSVGIALSGRVLPAYRKAKKG